jgi:hypothetical protein
MSGNAEIEDDEIRLARAGLDQPLPAESASNTLQPSASSVERTKRRICRSSSTTTDAREALYSRQAKSPTTVASWFRLSDHPRRAERRREADPGAATPGRFDRARMAPPCASTNSTG